MIAHYVADSPGLGTPADVSSTVEEVFELIVWMMMTSSEVRGVVLQAMWPWLAHLGLTGHECLIGTDLDNLL